MTVTPAPTKKPAAALKITSAALKNPSNKTLVYNGKARTPAVVVKGKSGGKTITLKKNTDYTVRYSSNRKVGTAMITITGTGSCSGSQKLTFRIIPKGTNLISVKAGNRRFTAKWKKQAIQTSGYQIRYSASKNMKSSKMRKIKNSRTLSITQKGLQKGKNYYVQIRTFKTVKGKTYWSKWSRRVRVRL